MKRELLLLLLFMLGTVGLFACGEIPEPLPSTGGSGQVNPTLGPSPLPTIPPAPREAPPAGEVILQDDFGSQIAATWAVLDIAQTPGERAYWYSADGILLQGGTDLGMDSVDSAYLVTNTGVDWTDYTVRAQVYVVSNDEVGLIFRVNDGGFYRFRMRSDRFEGPYQVGLDRYQDKRYTVLWHAAGDGFPFEKWFSLQVEAQGDTFTISVDGRVITTIQDASFAKGGVGFYAWAEGGAYFDNMVVTR